MQPAVVNPLGPGLRLGPRAVVVAGDIEDVTGGDFLAEAAFAGDSDDVEFRPVSHSARGRGLPLRIAQSPVQGAAAGPTAKDSGAPQQGSGGTPSTGDETPSLGGFGWTLAPVRWGGILTEELRLSQYPEQSETLYQVSSGSLRAGSYIWQPWFAQIGASIGFVISRLRSGEDNTVTGGSDSDSLTGGANLSLFPTSRFPFQALFDVSDSRASGDITASDYTRTRFGVRQSYQPLQRNASYLASYDRSVLKSNAFPRDTLDVLAASMTQNLGVHGLSAAGNFTRNERGRGEGSNLNSLNAQHNYRPAANLSVNTLASANFSEYTLANVDNLLTTNSSRIYQLNSFGTWRPQDGAPLYLTGSARAFVSETDNNGSLTDARSLSGTLAGNYTLNRNTNLYASAGVLQQTTSGGSNGLFTNQAGGITYASDPLEFGKFSWTWNATANAANITGTKDGSRQNGAGGIGHNLSRSYPLRENSVLRFDAGQNFSVRYDSVSGQSETVTNNAGVSWSHSPNAETITLLSLTASDSRTYGFNESEFQLINGQATGQVQFGRYSSGSANFTVQSTRSSTPDVPGGGFTHNASGNISYYHVRAFDVPLLRYTALYYVNGTQFNTRLTGDLNAPRDQVTQSFEQRLEYNIGRIDLRLAMRIADVDGRRNSLIFFRVSRQFGSF